MKDVDQIRKMFPITKKKVFLNHAGVTPPPTPVRDAVHTHLDKYSLLEGEPDDPNESRKLFAKLVNAEPLEIALVPNTSTGLNIAANALRYPRGCNVVTTDLEFPAVTYPWLRERMKRRVELRYVKSIRGKLFVEDFEEAVDDRTVAVTVSHVEYPNGFRNNLRALAEIAHDHGAAFIVDACQSAGALRVEVERDGVDFLATSCYKWLLGPSGAGFLYVRRELIDKCEPVFVGYEGVKPDVFNTVELWNNRELMLVDSASRFQTGGLSTLSFVGATAALRLIHDVGPDVIEKRVTGLAGHLLKRLKEEGFWLQTPEEPEYCSGIVNFLVKDPGEMVGQLRHRGIVVSARMNGVRVSPHFYNTEGELERLIDEVKGLK